MITPTQLLAAHILIVDDQQANIELLTRMLSDSGYTQIDSTAQAQQVCALHAQNHYDLILLDLQMPLMDGFVVMQALKAAQPGGFLPVIAITAHPGHKLRALDCGARDFVSKPFDFTELRTRIRNTLEVCMLYRLLEDRNVELEARVQERTQQLLDSEARFRSLTELACDWYWEQDDTGAFIKVTGPVLEMLGMGGEAASDDASASAGASAGGGWNASQHAQLKAFIAARAPFLDFILCRTYEDGTVQTFQISGEPLFNRWNEFKGYHGLGLDISWRLQAQSLPLPSSSSASSSSASAPSASPFTAPSHAH
jgi:CheY-like chemotaxis protein